jgi:hypothetical protein
MIIGAWNVSGEVHLQILDESLMPKLAPAKELLGPHASVLVYRADEGSKPHRGSGSPGARSALSRWHNFGVVEDDAKLRTEFLLENKHSGALTLSNPRVTCSCVNARILGSNVLAPGAKTSLVVELLAAPGRAVRQQVDLEVVDGDGHAIIETFYLFASSPEAARVAPAQLDFGATEWDGPLQRREFLILEAPGDPLEAIADASTSGDVVADAHAPRAVRTVFGEREFVNGRWRRRVEVVLDVSHTTYGRHNELLEISTSSRRAAMISVPVRYERRPPIDLPAGVSFGQVAGGAMCTKRIPLRARCSGECAVHARDPPPGSSVVLETSGVGDASLVFSYVFPTKPGSETVSLVLDWRCGGESGVHTVLQTGFVTDR